MPRLSRTGKELVKNVFQPPSKGQRLEPAKHCGSVDRFRRTTTGESILMHPSLEKAQAILETKSMDYQGKPDCECDPARQEYFPFGDESYLHMIHTKFERIKQTHNVVTQHESTLDSVLDMINYLAFYAAYLESINGDN
jgi:hypothetical protein